MSKQTHIHPRQLKGVKTYDIWEEMVLYSPERGMAFSLNRSAKAVWELCDGRHTPAEISQELGRRFDLAADELLSDVQAAIDQLHQLGLLELQEAFGIRSG